MRIILGGVRGTRPVTGPAHAGYGGDTTAALILGEAGERLLLDAGSGLANLEEHLGAPADPLLLAFSHYHLDHVLGLPALVALRQEGRRIALSGPRGLDRALSGLVGPPYWPLDLADFPARLVYPDPSARRLQHGGLEAAFCPVAHPGGCFAYRIQEEASQTALVFATDIEWAAMDQAQRSQFMHLCRQPFPASLLIMDGHLALDETRVRRGWGHSTYAEALHAADLCGVRRLLLTHHDPAHDDQALDDLAATLVDLGVELAPAIEAELARQGLIMEVPA